MYDDYLYIFDDYLSVCPVNDYANYITQTRNYLNKSVDNQNLMGVYFAIHLLFMCFIYQKIWQLHQLHTEKIDFVLDFISKKKREGNHFDYAKIGETNI
jgi:hypothetical protein